MSNELRDRTATAMRIANNRVAGFIGFEELADAVIAELGMREELRYQGRFSFMPPQRRRYVTDWITDE